MSCYLRLTRGLKDSVVGSSSTKYTLESVLKAQPYIIKSCSPRIRLRDTDSRGRKGTCYVGHCHFFIIALLAALFVFVWIAAAAAGIARILFFIFMVPSLVALLGGPL